ncbi:MAG TPA: glycosyltransferase family 2 protein, partial [Thermodesulfobacteriota bacterium]|nr:glycosyltransferase family 2 protein [Thermodesulfobacteriota bacterium]
MSVNPKVAIVIVTWNKKSYVMELLESLRNIDYDNHDVIVVDNASTDDTCRTIREKFPAVKLIENPENLGGTGGFNTGLRYVLKKGGYKYTWLLDNDAVVDRDTLIELVKVMEEDDKVGITGSIIMEPDLDMIVELGAYVSWSIGTWKPNYRNNRLSEMTDIDTTEVDYVAACSSLVRNETLYKIGVMDERYFIHWDDIDLSLRAKEAGYKVMASPRSKAYHGLEDKPINPLISYYDIRNGLLTITKHQNGFRRFLYILNMLRGTGKGAVYSLLSGLNTTSKLLVYGPLDFIRGKFYKSSLSVKTEEDPDPESAVIPFEYLNIRNESKVIILPNASYAIIKGMLAKIREMSPGCHVSLLIQADRYELFKDLEIDRFIVFEGYRQSTIQTLSVLKEILESNYDLCISPSRSMLPFSYAVKKYYLYDHKRDYFVQSKEDIYASWKLFVSFFGGELLAIVLMPFVYLKSLAH